jgi:tRNA pseudouridine38-40 synthase
MRHRSSRSSSSDADELDQDAQPQTDPMPAGAQQCARAVIEYDGTAFAGSQYQPNARTVQGAMEEALNRLTGERIRIRLAGRTDAGVHATGQVVAFCLPRHGGERVSWPELQRRLNAVLPPDLAVRSLRSAATGFDPRRDATWRVYRYRIRMAADRRPAERYRTLEIDDRLDVAAMRDAAAALLGERDFAALGSNVHGRTVRRLSEVRIVQRGTSIEVRVTANAFLRRMVRSIVALLVEAGRGRLAPEAVERLLAAGDRALYGRAVPAKGLTLERVRYLNTARGRESDPQAQQLRMKEQES